LFIHFFLNQIQNFGDVSTGCPIKQRVKRSLTGLSWQAEAGLFFFSFDCNVGCKVSERICLAFFMPDWPRFPVLVSIVPPCCEILVLPEALPPARGND
jgi:hypothetical protein